MYDDPCMGELCIWLGHQLNVQTSQLPKWNMWYQNTFYNTNNKDKSKIYWQMYKAM